MTRSAIAALVMAVIAATALPVRAADHAEAERVLQLIYGSALYQSEVDRLLLEADHKAVFGGAGSAPSARAKDRALTRQALLLQRDAVLRDASQRVADYATDAQLALLVKATERPDGPVDDAALTPAVTAVKRGFVEAVWDHMARYARSNASVLCRQGERSFCP
jgi:hypothetical protein